MPAVIRRGLFDNPAWTTSYTPYQAEISQGRLEALLVFQTMVCDLAGLPVANASLLDEASAAAEAMALCKRADASARRTFFVAADCHPQTIAVVRTRAACQGWEVVTGELSRAADEAVFGALLQYPATNGEVADLRPVIRALHARGACVAVAADPLALVLLESPGALGADIALGTTQRFGAPPGYGGPHAAYFACTEALLRGMPGRLVGVSRDALGEPALRLALQAREQHIRREKATSNICTSEVLLAAVAAFFAVYHGPDGLAAIARRVHRRAAVLAAGLEDLGWRLAPGGFFDTVTVHAGAAEEDVHARAWTRGINLRRAGSGLIGISVDELTTGAEIERLWSLFVPDGGAVPAWEAVDRDASDRMPPGLRRTAPLLTDPVFHRHRSETAMLRYLRALADRDLALDRTMIPLGSCTMKLSAASATAAVGWPEFHSLHPFAPPDQAAGYAELAADLARMLCAITGYDAVSLQPNSGAQGEFAGLLAIRAWQASRGEGGRRLVLIPESAHGTNPASAHLAGFDVVVLDCDRSGDVDLARLEATLALHGPEAAALMITYPSTHGVYEARIREVCARVHACGAQVYLDGANLNGLIGLAAPGRFGADVSHLNLHKTFAIPHGGGGPGVGPLAVRAHLAPFLPGHPLDPALADRPVGPVSAAPLGSASLLPIAWAYIRMMGAEGLAAATRTAVLAANYLATRLAPHFPVLYTGPGGRVAHECILDIRPSHARAGVSAEDVAKRLIDFGIHAPTLSFPVAGTLMVEPTESEPMAELDRFCAAMIAIRGEIDAIAAGRWPQEDNPLRHAPHTPRMLLAEPWTHPYSREEAAFPVEALRCAKYWAPVARVDNAYGDRHFVGRGLP